LPARPSTPPVGSRSRRHQNRSGPGWCRPAWGGLAGIATTCSTTSAAATPGGIVPELQHLAPGDIMPMGPGGQGIPVRALDPPRTMILGRPGDSSWVWQLDPCPDGSTRLICRIRSRIRPAPTSVLFNVLFEVADFWMLRKMLLNLRARAGSHMDPEATTGPGPKGRSGRTLPDGALADGCMPRRPGPFTGPPIGNLLSLLQNVIRGASARRARRRPR
jgi:hypothetical protein